MRQLLLLITLAAVLLPVRLWAETAVLDTLETLESDAGPLLRIRFTRPMQYLSHTPPDRGSQLRIELRPVGMSDDEPTQAEPPERETLARHADARVPVQRVSYEEVLHEHNLIVQLASEVNFVVRAAADFRAIDLIFPESVAAPAPVALWAVNLRDATGPIDTRYLPKVAALADVSLYVASFRQAGGMVYRLRGGPFASQAEAERRAARLRRDFPAASAVAIAPGEAAQIPRSSATPSPLSEADQARVQRAMQQAKSALLVGNPEQAVPLYTQVLALPEHAASAEALELLGLARERSGQSAHAKAEYERYLARYPQGEGAERVRQRLDALVTAALTPKSLREAKPRAEEQPGWELFGSLSQYYRRDALTLDGLPNETTRSELASDLNLVARKRGETTLEEFRLSGGYRHDLLSDGPGSLGSVSALYYDVRALDRRYQLRLGRQSNTHPGVMGRFDGLFGAYKVGEKGRVTGVVGAPVERSGDNPDGSRLLYGVGYAMDRLAERWELELYLIDQRNQGIEERRAVGSELRYLDESTTLFALVDYDTLFSELNTLMLLANQRVGAGSLNLTLDRRRSPTLTLSNALIGQSVTDRLDRLADLYTEEALRQLALDRSAESESYTAGVTYPLSERWQFNLDLGLSRLGAMPASGGVAAVDASEQRDTQIQLVGNGLLLDGDIGILSLRHSDADTSRSDSLTLQGRYRFASWRVTPRLRFEQRHYDASLTQRQQTFSPSLQAEYRYGRSLFIDLELGYESTRRELTDGTRQDESSDYLSLGYRWEF